MMVHTVDTSLPSLDIVGEFEGEQQAKQILELCREMCGWRVPTFPGSQPVSLNRSNIQKIVRNPYVVCEKTDGVRYLLLAINSSKSKNQDDKNEVCALFFIGRNEEVQRVNMKLPSDTTIYHHRTLLDGEMVLDEIIDEEGNRKNRRRFLIYDAISISGDTSISRMNLLQRLAITYKEVIEPLVAYLSTPEGASEERGFDIFLKDFFETWDIQHISKFAAHLPHTSDGLIFTPVRPPYVPGTCQDLIKWKPPHLNTVDFQPKLVYGSNSKSLPIAIILFCTYYGVRAFCGHLLAPYGDIYKDLINPENGRAAETSIVECCWVPEAPIYTFIPQHYMNMKSAQYTRTAKQLTTEDGFWFEGGWVAERIRTDKKLPNAHSVSAKVVESIEDEITFEELVQKFDELKKSGKSSVLNSI